MSAATPPPPDGITYVADAELDGWLHEHPGGWRPTPVRTDLVRCPSCGGDGGCPLCEGDGCVGCGLGGFCYDCAGEGWLSPERAADWAELL